MELVKEIFTRSISKAHLVHVAKQWLATYDSAFYTQNPIPAMETRLSAFFDIVFVILENYKFPKYMIIPVMMYADKFAQKQGIKHDQLFYLVLASTIVCIKFWDDNTSLKNSSVAQSFNYSLKSVNSIERNFLKGVDYQLSLSASDMLKYIQEISVSKLQGVQSASSVVDSSMIAPANRAVTTHAN
eukprot:TRINITY_DN2150_c0_g1_i1.p1 TRINITY_DN2150_c0_g1~~TRINITY_DN2150_c0_g1_i1.p1  ORF type:complete len:186 (-),score=19.88 TRINITY_DN2150_c0_g1_i1:186-743(-)